MVCLRQLDVKSIVAYSSIVHIGVSFSALLGANIMGLKSCLYECLAHGVSSPLMFYGLYMFYGFFNTRRLVLLKGSGMNSPLHSYVIFLVVAMSLGVPPFLSFFF